jgi:hypothetical protein
MGIGMVAMLAFAVVAAQPWVPAAEAQHSHAWDAQHDPAEGGQHPHGEEAQHGHASAAAEHFHALIEQLALTEAQQEAVAQPFQEAFAAMQKLHQMHDVIAAELTGDQRAKLAQMIHEMLAASFGQQASGHDAPHH